MNADPTKVIEGDVYTTVTLSRQDRLSTNPAGQEKDVEWARHNTLAYIALTERMLRHVVNDATHGGEKNKVTVPAVTFGLGQKRGQREAYQEAYRLGAEMVVFDMLYDMTQMHFGILGTSYLLSPLYLFKAAIGLTPEQHENLEYEMKKSWTLDVDLVYTSITDAMRIPLGLVGIQVGLASLMLQEEFELEEDKKVVEQLLRRYSLITKQQAELMLDAWRVSTANLLDHHMVGRYI